MNLSAARAIRWNLSAAALLLAIVAADRAPAQDADRLSAKEPERQKLEEMKQVVGRFQMEAIDERGQAAPAQAPPEPLHRWTDPTRDFSGGALWAWRVSGRPVAIVGVEDYGYWSLEFVSLSTGRLKADDSAGTRWNPAKGGVEYREVPGASAPADEPAGRLRQIRELARKFSAREHWDGRDHMLRLLPHPIDRYADPGSGVVDGALFLYANGTNPEILLMIEARRQGEAPPRWHFAAAPLGKADLYLSLGSREVWHWADDSDHHPGPDRPYFIAHLPRPRNGR